MTCMLDVRRLEDLAEFRSDWEHLLHKTPGANFFQSLDWLEVYWRHFARGQELRVIITLDGAEPVGIVPLCIRSVNTKVGACRILTYPLDDWGSFYGPISEQPEKTLATVLEHLDQNDREWDMVDLRWIWNSANGTATHTAFRQAGLKPHIYPWEETALVHLPGTWDQYLAGRTSKCRRSYRRSERRVAERGSVEYIRYRPGGVQHGQDDPRWDLYDTCEEIARRSWQGESTTGTTLSHDSVRDYLREMHVAAVRCGAADINLLLLDDQPAAFMYNYIYQGWLHALRTGFDPSVSDRGVGRVLMGRIVQDSIARGDRVIDMGTGALECKYYWLTSVEPIGRYVHFVSNSPKGQLLKLALQVDNWFRTRFATRATVTAASGEELTC